MATALFKQYFQNSNQEPLINAQIYLVPIADEYPTNAIKLIPTEVAGVYQHSVVETGSYKLYIQTLTDDEPILISEITHSESNSPAVPAIPVNKNIYENYVFKDGYGVVLEDVMTISNDTSTTVPTGSIFKIGKYYDGIDDAGNSQIYEFRNGMYMMSPAYDAFGGIYNGEGENGTDYMSVGHQLSLGVSSFLRFGSSLWGNTDLLGVKIGAYGIYTNGIGGPIFINSKDSWIRVGYENYCTTISNGTINLGSALLSETDISSPSYILSKTKIGNISASLFSGYFANEMNEIPFNIATKQIDYFPSIAKLQAQIGAIDSEGVYRYTMSWMQGSSYGYKPNIDSHVDYRFAFYKNIGSARVYSDNFYLSGTNLEYYSTESGVQAAVSLGISTTLTTAEKEKIDGIAVLRIVTSTVGTKYAIDLLKKDITYYWDVNGFSNTNFISSQIASTSMSSEAIAKVPFGAAKFSGDVIQDTGSLFTNKIVKKVFEIPTNTYNMGAFNSEIFVYTGSGNSVIMLPTIAYPTGSLQIGSYYTFVNNTTSILTLSASSPFTINGLPSASLSSRYAKTSICYVGSNLWITL